ncbi:hypothetical protein MMC25_007961 [Agyrium rufum]|nr:hypothetical protein [Agyrium rufum]
MGAGQSRNNVDGEGNHPVRTCYYELLGVEKTATDNEIKRAYRGKALEYHPDRNYGNIEHATHQFAEIQSAYEVLADPQERAWYDSHRDAILHGQDGPMQQDDEHKVSVTTADEVLRFCTSFSNRADMSDSEGSFYSQICQFFVTLAHEEELASAWEGLELEAYPSFGRGDDDYEHTAKPFYEAWSAFSTRKTFSWKDMYRSTDAPDRRVRRAMEKENRKLRDEAIREFNDAVRSLVAFVKRRDNRYIANTQNEAERQNTLRIATAAQAARSRAANKAELKEHDLPEWTRLPTAEDDQHIFEESSEDVEEYFECLVCKKTFKSEKQYNTHEQSKKHTKAVALLQKEMKIENALLGLDETDTDAPHQNGDGLQTPFKAAASEQQAVPISPRVNTTTMRSGPVEAPIDIESQMVKKAEESKSSSPKPTISCTGSSNTDGDFAPRKEVEQRIAGRRQRMDDSASKGSQPEAVIKAQKIQGNARSKKGMTKMKRAKKAARNEITDSETAKVYKS